MAHGTSLHQQILTGFVILVVQLRSYFATSNVDLEVESLNSSSAKLLKSRDSDVNRGGPDVVVLRDHSASSESSSKSRDEERKDKCVYRTKERPPYAVIEVTSESTRTNDLTSKWIQYAITGIKFCYIVDLSYFETSEEACVIVGSLERFDDAVQCCHGSPNTPPSSWTPPDVATDRMYYKKVYRGDEIVDAGVFKGIQLASANCMDPVHLGGMSRSLKDGYGRTLAGKAHGKPTRSGSSVDPVREETSSFGPSRKGEKHFGTERSPTKKPKRFTALSTSSSSPALQTKSVRNSEYE